MIKSYYYTPETPDFQFRKPHFEDFSGNRDQSSQFSGACRMSSSIGQLYSKEKGIQSKTSGTALRISAGTVSADGGKTAECAGERSDDTP